MVNIRFVYFMSLTLVPLGLSLNALQAFIYTRKKFSNTRMGFYFTVSLRHKFEVDLFRIDAKKSVFISATCRV